VRTVRPFARSPRYADERSRLEFETMISELSSRFINLPPSDVDRELEDALRRVCEHLGVDYAVLWQWSVAAPDVLVPTHAYPLQEGPRPREPLRQELYPWVIQRGRAGRITVVPSWEEMPAEAAVDQESARSRGIKSSLGLPLSVGGQPPVGILAFNTTRAERDWPDELVKRLQLVAQVFTNALARRRADQFLRESEATSRVTFDQAAVGIAHVGIDGRWLRVNDKLCAIVGYPREELLQLTFQDITHPDDLKADLKQARQCLAGAIKSYSMEKRYVRRDRSLVWIKLTVSLVRTAAGDPRHFIGIVWDITERKRAEAAARASQARLEAATDLAGLAFYEVDFGDRSVFVDKRFGEVGGYPAGTLPGLEAVEFWMGHVHPEDRQRFLDVREQLHGGKVERASAEYRYLHPAKGQRWINQEARVTSRDASGRTIRTFGVVRDITERRQREEALRQSLAEIERLKDRLQAESDYLKAEIKVVHAHGEVTGESPAIQKVLRQVEQVAATDSSVLVRGETGTGKELVAQAIHRLSARQGHLMVRVNCAALPSGLIESELFGREKGAFTGAMTRQVGRFEVADGSTLFLDEVGELSLEVQAKLLRVLEAGEFERLGSPRTIKVDVRLVAATNRDLAEGIKKGRFREDLYYRLNVFPIRVPPLRERTEDIPLLVWTFLEEFSTRMGKKITQVPRKTMDALVRHSWPGNVRELRNVIEHAAILTTGDTLRVPLLEGAAAVAAPSPTLAASERELILRALEKRGWRVKGPTGAAAALGLNPSTLYSRMKKLGIRPPGPEEDGASRQTAALPEDDMSTR
jgi:formate hydrogenlyase transcriptional activator